RDIEDKCIREVVALQQRVGLQSITDGEFRRTSFREGLFEHVDGFSKERYETDFAFTYQNGTVRRATPVPKVVGRLKRREGIATEELKFLRPLTDATVKICQPSPSVVHWFIGNAVLSEGVYATARDYMADVSAIYRAELAELAALGCTYVQFDEVSIPIMCDPVVQEIIAGRGENHLDLVDLYVDAINDAIGGRPAGMTVCVHMCRGNEGVAGMGSGGYDAIAERTFGRLAVDGYLLEYDTPRAGDFAALRYMPRDKIVALGLISTKVRDLEPVDDLRRRVDEASAHVDMDRLCLSPQCGFASAFHYDRFTIADQERKLAHLVAAAATIWPD
ncbi:MAG: 5-methyltetrahydropteroyltriglutamate--homocysteine S-methyltransferase, partial [Candidatus Eiseniibacteriota bacterium]